MPRTDCFKSSVIVAPDPQAQRQPRRAIPLVQECAQRAKRRVTREDQLGRPALQGHHNFVDPRLDQTMIALSLVAEQVVDKEVPGGAVKPRIEVQGALPAPDVEVRIIPDGRAPAKLAPKRTQYDPLPPSFIAARQLL